MTKAVQEMGKAETFRGYGPEQGYDFSAKQSSKARLQTIWHRN